MSIAEENSQEKRMKEVIESGMKFNKRIDELVKESIEKAEEVKHEIREYSMSDQGHMTHSIDEYVNCVPAINRDKLKHLLQKDIE